MEIMSRLKGVKSINLSENSIAKLPANMQMLSNLEEINLNGNPIEDIQAATDALQTIGPNLKTIHINLYEEDQVDYMLRSLEWLEVLNGLRVEREALFNQDDSSSDDENDEDREGKTSSPSRKSYCSPLRKQLSEVEEKPEQESAPRRMHIEPILELSGENNSTNVGCKSQLELITKTSASFGNIGTKSQEQINEMQNCKSKLSNPAATEQSIMYQSNAQLSAATKEDERNVETTSTQNAHKSSQLLQHQTNEPNMFSLNPDFLGDQHHQSINIEEGQLEMNYQNSIDADKTSEKLSNENKKEELLVSGQTSALLDNFLNQKRISQDPGIITSSDANFNNNDLILAKTKDHNKGTSSLPLSTLMSERQQSAVAVDTTSRISNNDLTVDKLIKSPQLDGIIESQNQRNDNNLLKDSSKPGHTQSKSSLRYSNKEVEALSSETVFKNESAMLSNKGNQMNRVHANVNKQRNQYEVYDANSLHNTTDQMQNSVQTINRQFDNVRYDEESQSYINQSVQYPGIVGGPQIVNMQRKVQTVVRTLAASSDVDATGANNTNINDSMASQGYLRQMQDSTNQQSKISLNIGLHQSQPIVSQVDNQLNSFHVSQNEKLIRRGISNVHPSSSHVETVNRSFSQKIGVEGDKCASQDRTDSHINTSQMPEQSQTNGSMIKMEQMVDQRDLQNSNYVNGQIEMIGGDVSKNTPTYSKQFEMDNNNYILKNTNEFDNRNHFTNIQRSRTASPAEMVGQIRRNPINNQHNQDGNYNAIVGTQGSTFPVNKSDFNIHSQHSNLLKMNNMSGIQQQNYKQLQEQIESKFSLSMKSQDDVVRIRGTMSKTSQEMQKNNYHINFTQEHPIQVSNVNINNQNINHQSNLIKSSQTRRPTNLIDPKEVAKPIINQPFSLYEDLTTPPFTQQNPPQNTRNQGTEQQVINNQSSGIQNGNEFSEDQKILRSCLSQVIAPLQPALLPGLSLDDLELTSSDLEHVAIIYDKIRSLFKQLTIEKCVLFGSYEQTNQHNQPLKVEDILKKATELSQEVDQSLAQQFDQRLTEIMEELNLKQQALVDVQRSATRRQSVEEGSIGEEYNAGDDELSFGLIQQSVHKATKSLILQQKYNLIQLCFEKTMDFMSQIQQAEQQETDQSIKGSDEANQITLSVYMAALQSVLVNLQSYQMQIQNKLFLLSEEEVVESLPQQTGYLSQILDQRMSQKNEIQQVQAQNDLKDIEIRELQLKLMQKEQDIDKLTQQFSMYNTALKSQTMRPDGTIIQSTPMIQQNAYSMVSSMPDSQRISCKPLNENEDQFNQLQVQKFSVPDNQFQQDGRIVPYQKDIDQQINQQFNTIQYEQHHDNATATVRAASNGGRNSGTKQKLKKSLTHRSGANNRSRGGDQNLPKFSNQYEIHHNANASAYSSEFVVTQNLSPRNESNNAYPINQALKTMEFQAHQALPKAIMKSKQLKQNQVKSIGPSNLSNQPHAKVLPLKLLKDLIQDIYSQKLKYDKKCYESQLPVETMEQYMYNYLNQKYGLKTLIVEWASTIITGVKCYVNDDHDVKLFAKILKNECDEEFRFVQMHVRHTLGYLLKQVLREKFTTKSQQQISQECEAIQNSQIEEWQWKKILNRMYERNDVAIITERLRNILDMRKRTLLANASDTSILSHSKSVQGMHSDRNKNQEVDANNDSTNLGYLMQKKMTMSGLRRADSKGSLKPQPRQKSKSRLTREEQIVKRKQAESALQIMYQSDFEKTILDFQLEEHERFLQEFNKLFKEVDEDQNGVIDEDEFKQLVINMGVVVQNQINPQQDIEALLSIIDPHNNKQMTYSQVVQLLSNQLEQHPRANTNLSRKQSTFNTANNTQILYGSQNNYVGQLNHINNSVSKAANYSDVAGYHNVRPNFNNDIQMANGQFQQTEMNMMQYTGFTQENNNQYADPNMSNEQGKEEFIEQYDEAEDSQSQAYHVTTTTPLNDEAIQNNIDQNQFNYDNRALQSSGVEDNYHLPPPNENFIPILDKFYNNSYSTEMNGNMEPGTNSSVHIRNHKRSGTSGHQATNHLDSYPQMTGQSVAQQYPLIDSDNSTSFPQQTSERILMNNGLLEQKR